MAISSRKITTYADNMKDLPVIPNIPGTEVLAKMDGRTDNEVKNSINGIVDDLVAVTDGASGADQVGATLLKAGGAATVQGQLEELKADKVEINASITGATKCKITYDAKGLVTSGENLTKTDLPSEAITTDNVIQEITGASRTDKVISEKAYNDKQIVIGAADMLQSTYDPQGKHADAFDSANHKYDNAESGMTATNVKDAIDETHDIISNYSSYAGVIDANGIYTVVDYKRADGTLYMKSTLSGGTSPKYTTDTWKFYSTDGTTLLSTKTWTITYDANGGIVSKVVA